MLKIGRRGSLNAWIGVPGAQGHVAYPDLADNPIPRLLAILTALDGTVLDDGSEWFSRSNLEITDIVVGNPATNMIPAQASARLNIRFNDRHSGAGLTRWLRDTVALHAPAATVVVKVSGEPFLTAPGCLSAMVCAAVTEETGRTPALSTSGGTSDARFIRRLCPVVEFGLPGLSMHGVDEQVATNDVEALARIYDRLLQKFFAAP
jgi:succinyl-diaminopimelate desuccinylase